MSMHNLARAYMISGRVNDAVPLEEKTVQQCKQELGPTHPDTLACMNLLASAYRRAGRVPDAVRLFEETLPLLKEKHGPAHPHTLTTMQNLAGAYRDAGRLADAVKLYAETLPLQEETIGNTHPQTLTTRRQLAHAYSLNGQMELAIATCEEGLKLKPDDPKLYLKLAELLSIRRPADERGTQRAVEIASKATELSPQDLGAWRLLGLARYWAGDYDGSIAALQKSLSVRSNDHVTDSFDLFILAVTHAKLGHNQQAQKYYDDAITWMEANLPEDKDLLYFRAEAAKVLGVAEPKPKPTSAPPAAEPTKTDNPITTKTPESNAKP
jgi:tetratricopeptide (TPR) repeat protein